MPEVPPVSRPDRLIDLVEAAFADDGPLARRVPAFEPRSGQRQMAAAAAGVLSDGGLLLVEAGTGTGKTLAYLVPAVLSRQRVLVSTGTKNLQEQIFFKDLPVLREALGIPFTATCMKGRGNYLCLHRFEAFRESPAIRTPAERAALEAIAGWAPHSEWGDRAELEDLPEDLPFWGEIAATSENCLGKECPRYQDCFVTRLRQRAAESDLVIVNHHLLCADAAVRQSAYGEVIPAFHHAVVDEAHQLEDVATQYFGLSVGNHRLEDLVREGERVLAAGLVPEAARVEELRQVLERARSRARQLFARLQDLLRTRPAEWSLGPRTLRAQDERVRLSAERLQPATEPGRLLTDTLATLEAAVAALRDVPEDVAAVGRRAREIREELAFLLDAADTDYVFFLEARGRSIFLRASPIDVSGIVREFLFDRMHATVLTSATLAVDGSFDYIRSRLGAGRAIELALPSEFDYAQQAILYLPRRMPDPRSAAFPGAAAREILEILRRTEGRAFVLFTSYAMLRETEAVVRPVLPYPLLVQGTAPRSALLREFRLTPHAVLLATASFWQGVDVVGEALSCVIIDKLPFASPGDPITAARLDAIAAAGGDPFTLYQVPLAILTLLQGLGRLLRHRDDRGLLAVLDPRLRTKGYGARFLSALPPAPVVMDPAAIERFFARPGRAVEADA